MTHYLTSDLHLGHVRAPEFRGFESVETMNETLITCWNVTVGESDTVWILGDLVMGHKAETLPLVKRLHGEKFLLPGNHDPMSEAYHHSGSPEAQERKRREWRQKYEDVGITVLDPIQTATFHEVTFDLCHFPYYGDHTDEDRFLDQRPPDNGRWLLHGHTHGMWKVRDRMIDVGVDNWNWCPVDVGTLVPLTL